MQILHHEIASMTLPHNMRQGASSRPLAQTMPPHCPLSAPTLPLLARQRPATPPLWRDPTSFSPPLPMQAVSRPSGMVELARDKKNNAYIAVGGSVRLLW